MALSKNRAIHPPNVRVIEIPRVKDSEVSWVIAALWSRVSEVKPGDMVQFDFARCPVVQPALIVSLAGMSDQISRNGMLVMFINMRPAVRSVMSGLGYPIAVNLAHGSCSPNAVRLRHDLTEDKNGIIEYLRTEWLAKSGIKMSAMLSNALVGQLWEAYANAFEHSQSPMGVITYGEHKGANNLSEIAIADFGMSIPTKLNQFEPTSLMTASAAMRWAFERGNTTEVDAGMPRGMGLSLLKSFVQKNNGTLEVFSGRGKVTVTAQSETYGESGFSVPGVLFQLKMICDDRRYILSTETGPPTKLF